jgi:Kef-type K+ transport system membrane component KefB
MTPFELSVRFFLQLAIILSVCKAVGWVGTRFGQPPVVGEMIAGVFLGPSLFGLFAPQWQAFLFPKESKAVIFSVAQIGLVLYMFIVGLEFRVDLVRARMKSALAISFSGILVPFGLGCAVALWLVSRGGFFTDKVGAWRAAPYLGAAMAITAFPMLARIIVERRLTKTTVGALSLAAGAIDDAAAWCVLALVLASFAHDAKIALFAIGGSVLLVAVLFTVGRKLLGAMVTYAEKEAGQSRAMFGWMMVLLMAAAWYTDSIGIYAVFGAFALGVAVPRGAFTEELREKIEPLTTHLLLPLFFIYSGLNTRFDLLDNTGLWLIMLGVLAAAVVGKGAACYVAARLCGEGHREAMGVGCLMNARGLMELIILNIGLERGLITPTLFSIMVFMAIATTLMATPLFNWVYGNEGVPLERTADTRVAVSSLS